jgi:hypothetical protein
MKDSRQKKWAAIFALVGMAILAPICYFALRAMVEGNTGASSNTVNFDQDGAGALGLWIGGIVGALIGGRIGSDYGLKLRQQDKAQARRERYARVIEEYERDKASDPEAAEEEERLKEQRRRSKKKPFSPWP